MWQPRAPRLSTVRPRRLVIASAAVGLPLAVAVAAACHTLSPSGTRASVPADWPSYVYGVERTGFNASETGISPSSAPNLQQLWTTKAPAVVSVQPVAANGLVYWGAWDGVERATRLNGTLAWSSSLGTTTPPPACSGAAHGVLGSATVTATTIGGTAQAVVYVAGGNDTFYALNAATGAIIWQNQLAASPNEIWDSPAVYNGSVYIGLASWSDCPLTQAKVFQLDAATGAILHTFNVVPDGCTGAGVWGSISIDPATGLLFFPTGNSGTCAQAEPYGYAIVALHAADLSYASSWQVPAAQRVSDGDFGSAPTVFSATIGGVTRELVAVANKNGIYYAFDEANIAAGPIWQSRISVGGTATSGKASISPSAWDGTNLYVAGGNTTINGQSCKGGLRAVDPATGAFVWQVCLQDGFVLGPVAAVPGVVAVGEGDALALMATSDGHSLFKALDSTGSVYYGGPSIANGIVYIGNSDGSLFAFGTSSTTPTSTPIASDTATRTPTRTATNTPSPTATATGSPTATSTAIPTTSSTATPTIDPALDTDGDGIPNAIDDCPDVSNPDQLNTDAANTAANRPGADSLGDVCDDNITGDGYTNAQHIALVKDPALYCGIMRADVDGDGHVSILDLTKAAKYFTQTFTLDLTGGVDTGVQRLNQDGDTEISILDLTAMASHFLQDVNACP